MIRCRFAAHSNHVRELGKYLYRHRTQSFLSHFRVQVADGTRVVKVVQVVQLAPQIPLDMIDTGSCMLVYLTIPVGLSGADVFIELCLDEHGTCVPISGFPRRLPLDERASPEQRCKSHESRLCCLWSTYQLTMIATRPSIDSNLSRIRRSFSKQRPKEKSLGLNNKPDDIMATNESLDKLAAADEHEQPSLHHRVCLVAAVWIQQIDIHLSLIPTICRRHLRVW